MSLSEISRSDYNYWSTAADLRVLSGSLAMRLRADLSEYSKAPVWRSPAYGGGHVLRAAPVGRHRAPLLGAAVVEWRQTVTPLIGLTVFAEGAWSTEWHAGGGLGLRLNLPPRPHNTLRLDIAYGPAGPTLTAGWGESF
jgi:hypothetical protein